MKYRKETIVSIVGIIFGISIIVITHLASVGVKIWGHITDLDLVGIFLILLFASFLKNIYQANKK